jgi:hypothetical protein
MSRILRRDRARNNSGEAGRVFVRSRLETANRRWIEAKAFLEIEVAFFAFQAILLVLLPLSEARSDSIEPWELILVSCLTYFNRL